jgi:hypothetical protein
LNKGVLDSQSNWYTEISDILADYQSNKIHTHTPIWLKLNVPVQTLIPEKTSKELLKPLEIRLNINGDRADYYQDSYVVSKNNENKWSNCFYRTTPGRVLMNKLINLVN